MKFLKIILIIVAVFYKTQNVLSKENIFNVNNIELLKKSNISNEDLANQAIKKGFEELKEKILLKQDIKRLSQLKFSQIKNLVSYYQVILKDEENVFNDKVSYNIFFDKKKIHKLFNEFGILYSEIIDKEIYLLPIIERNNQFYIYNQNFFYDKWNEIYPNNVIEFILPLENIEVIQKVNQANDNFLELNLRNIFKEYAKKNLALVLIQISKTNDQRIYLKTNILGKEINKNIKIKKLDSNDIDFNKKIIEEVSEEITNIVKSQNLIDIRTPSFLNVRLNVSKNSNLVELNSRIKNIESVENVYVQDFNMNYMNLRIKYLGKLEKLISLLKIENINLQQINDQWIIKTL